jgi:hypothetical protein
MDSEGGVGTADVEVDWEEELGAEGFAMFSRLGMSFSNGFQVNLFFSFFFSFPAGLASSSSSLSSSSSESSSLEVSSSPGVCTSPYFSPDLPSSEPSSVGPED